jgi:hypothetical protein
MKPEIKEALNVMGCLLEHNGNIGAAAVSKSGREVWPCDATLACSWCLVGAKMLVGKCLLGDYYSKDLSKAARKLLTVPKGKPLEWIWEGPGSSDKTRKQIVEKLKNA